MKWILIILWINSGVGDVGVSVVREYDTHDACYAALQPYYDNLHAYNSDCFQVEVRR